MDRTPGERIKFLRLLRGWHQEDLAQKVGLNREALSRIENNKRQVEANELCRFSDELGVSSDQLLGRIPLDEVNLEKITHQENSKDGMRISVPEKNVQTIRQYQIVNPWNSVWILRRICVMRLGALWQELFT